MSDDLKKLITDALRTGGSIVAYDENSEMIACYGSGMGESMLSAVIEHAQEANPLWRFGVLEQKPGTLFTEREARSGN